MLNIRAIFGGSELVAPKIGEKYKRLSTEDLVADIRARIGKDPVSADEANRVLVHMDFDDVERQIFGVRDLSVVPVDVNAHGDVVPSGYPFMDRVRSIFSHREQKKGFFSLR